MPRKIRIALAAVFFLAVTVLFLDPSGSLRHFIGWTAKMQLLPAVLSLNLVVIIFTALLTIVFGRVYCSIICPLGVLQDIISNLSGRRKGKKNRFTPRREAKWLRYGVWALFVAAIAFGVQAFVELLAPYSAYGRILSSLRHPLLPTAIIAAVTFAVIAVLAWRGGRTWCNTVCPVGTTLSFLSRFSLLRPVIDTDKCRDCHLCEKRCKASCININEHKVDYSRCVACLDCIDNCKAGALKYRATWGGNASAKDAKSKEVSDKQTVVTKDDAKLASATQQATQGTRQQAESDRPKSGQGADAANKATQGAQPDSGRRAFIATAAFVTAATALKAQQGGIGGASGERTGDGGFADIIPKTAPVRTERLTPFGSLSVGKFYASCTACQLCVTHCPNHVLKPSTDIGHFMQPYMSYEDGYCRPECVTCSELCPAGAIRPISREEKSSFHIGTATVDRSLCVVERDGVSCGNCARHCPVGAITMVQKEAGNPSSPLIPAVNEARCIGCGACENLCPSRPVSAIHVNGLQVHIKD